jgi:glycosyltransferase involved in cell wall biosynthesis
MRICFVAPNVYPVLAGVGNIVGGAEVQQAILARGLAERGHVVSLLCFDFGQEERCSVDGVRICKLDMHGPRIVILRYLYPRLTSVWQGMRQAGADIYYQRCAGAYTGIVAAYCRRYGRRFVFACASDNDLLQGRRNILKSWRDRQLFVYGLRRADAVVVQTLSQQRAYFDWQQRQAVLIPSSYAPSLRSMAEKEGVVLWVGVLRRQKQPELFLELARRLPGHRFRMIGGPCLTGRENDFYREIEAAARQLPNLDFLGFVPYREVEGHFNAARVFVNTSSFEGFPNTFLQAWAHAMPTLSFFDCGAADDRGPIAPPSITLDDMELRLHQLMLDDAVWCQAGARCQRYFHLRHSRSAALDAYESLFVSITTGQSAQATESVTWP